MDFILKTLGWLVLWIINIVFSIVQFFIGWGLPGWIILGIVTVVVGIPVIGAIGFVGKHVVNIWLHLLGNAITFIITIGLVLCFILFIVIGFFSDSIDAWLGML